MLRGDRPTLEGRWYAVRDAINSPAPVGRIPVMIGGAGERKTLRMAAQYADDSNLICPIDDIPRKVEVLDAHCAKLGRDRSDITVTYQTSVAIAPTREQAIREADEGSGRPTRPWPASPRWRRPGRRSSAATPTTWPRHTNG